MNGIIVIDLFAFSNCSATDVSLPNSCVSVDNYAFAGTQQLKKLVLPSNLQVIGDNCVRRKKGV
jgi:hypothetical protein